MTETTQPAVAEVTADPRAGYIEGLRQLAKVLEQNSDLPLPYEGTLAPVTFHFLSGDDPKGDMTATMRALPTRFYKDVREGTPDYFYLRGSLAGLKVQLVAYRNTVCTRVEVGTETVTEEVPDPEALAAVPTVTVTREVPKYDWECQPILAAAADTPLDLAASVASNPVTVRAGDLDGALDQIAATYPGAARLCRRALESGDPNKRRYVSAKLFQVDLPAGLEQARTVVLAALDGAA